LFCGKKLFPGPPSEQMGSFGGFLFPGNRIDGECAGLNRHLCIIVVLYRMMRTRDLDWVGSVYVRGVESALQVSARVRNVIAHGKTMEYLSLIWNCNCGMWVFGGEVDGGNLSQTAV